MTLDSHPAWAKLREAADASLAAAQAALTAHQAKLQQQSPHAKSSGSVPASPQQLATPVKKGSGSQRSGSNVVRSGKKGDRIRVEPVQVGPAAPAPVPASSALKGMNVQRLRQRALGFGVDEEEVTAAVEGPDPKEALIALILAVEAPAAADQSPAPGGGGGEPAASSALKGMSVRSLRQRASELGVKEEELAAAVESSDAKKALIRLIQAKEASMEGGELCPLESLPAMLRAALREVEGVDTGEEDGEGGEDGGSVCKQLQRMKQSYLAELSAALAQVEQLGAPVAAARARKSGGRGAQARGGGPSAGAESDGGSSSEEEEEEEEGRQASLLESMEGFEVLYERLLAPLPVERLAAVGLTCRSLRAVVRSPDMQRFWEAHWLARWGTARPRSAEGRELSVSAAAFSHRANVELAWSSTRWSAAAAAGGGGGGGGGGAASSSSGDAVLGVEGRRTGRASSVRCAGAVLSAPQHEVCCTAFDSSRGHSVTGDTDGLVRVWDVAQCMAATSAGEALGRECRLSAHRLHHKNHAIRWVAAHERRLLAGCCASGERSGEAHAGRLVLVDLDDRSTNPGQRNLGVASSALDAQCGLVGSGPAESGGNGLPERLGCVGVGRNLVALDLELEHATSQQRPLRTTATVAVAAREEEEVAAVAAALGVGGSAALCVAVGTSFGEACVVDLACWHPGSGVEPTEQSVVRRWAPSDAALELARARGGGVAALAAVRPANAILSAWHPHPEAASAGAASAAARGGWRGSSLRVLDPRDPEAAGELEEGPAVLSLFSPPDCSLPVVLAAVRSGEVLAVDLRMLGRPWAEWPVVVAREAGGGGSCGNQVASLSGDARTLFAARAGGALVGVLGRAKGAGAGAGAEDGGGEEGEEAGTNKWERFKQEREERKKAERERRAAKASKKQTKDAGRRQTTGRQGGRSKGSR